MKRTLIKTYPLIIILLVCISCDWLANGKKKMLTINNYSKPIKDSLVISQEEGKNITTYLYKVTGYASDTIIVGSNSEPHLGNKLIGEIDTTFKLDFYGAGNVYFHFNPYLASEGSLKVTMEVF